MNFRKSTYDLFYKVIFNYQKNKNLKLAYKIQRRYSEIILKHLTFYNEKPIDNYNTIAGFDLSFSKISNKAIGGIIILDKKLNIIEKKYLITDVLFPYIPGLLAFRELDIILKLLKQIETKPDILCFDGQGIAHPRYFGIACYGGILTDTSSIGIAKSLLVGFYHEPAEKKGSREQLLYKNQQVGWAFRSREHTKPIFISPGWKISLKYLTDFIFPYCKYRIPEPTRLAHNYVNEIKQKLNLK